MSKILIISCVFPPEPVVSAMLSKDIADYLSQENEVSVLCPKPSRPAGFRFERKFETCEYKINYLESFTFAHFNLIGRFRESFSFGVHCARYIQKNSSSIDCIYINSWPLFSQFYIVKTANKLNIPTVLHVQDIYPESLIKKISFIGPMIKAFLLPLDKFILAKSSRIIAISEKMKEHLAKTRKVNYSKISVILNWQKNNVFDHQNRRHLASRKPFTLMYLGNIGPVAGVSLLMDAFVKANVKDSRLIIAGSGSMKDTLVRQSTKYLNQNIEFWPVADGKVFEIQGIADVLLLPVKKGNAFTSIPSKLPAYMFSAKPIIASVDQNSDTAVTINKANCGFVVEPENVESLSRKMIEVCKMKSSELEILGRNGREYALQNLSQEANLQKVVSIIESLI